MAYGSELVLGIRGIDNITKWLTLHGFKVIDIGDYEAWSNYLEPAAGNFPSLLAAHTRTLEAFFENVQFRWPRYTLATTPAGVREFSPFTFELFYDPWEMGDDPENAILGISLSGRYFPTFLDWRERHGTITNLRLDTDEFRGMVERARTEIAKDFPLVKDFGLFLVERHY